MADKSPTFSSDWDTGVVSGNLPAHQVNDKLLNVYGYSINNTLRDLTIRDNAVVNDWLREGFGMQQLAAIEAPRQNRRIAQRTAGRPGVRMFTLDGRQVAPHGGLCEVLLRRQPSGRC